MEEHLTCHSVLSAREISSFSVIFVRRKGGNGVS